MSPPEHHRPFGERWPNPRPCRTVFPWAGNSLKADSFGGKFIFLLPQRSRQPPHRPGLGWAHWAVSLTRPEAKSWSSGIGFFSRICSVLPRAGLGISLQADRCLGESWAMQHHCYCKEQLLWHCLDLGITQQNALANVKCTFWSLLPCRYALGLPLVCLTAASSSSAGCQEVVSRVLGISRF